jgi:riboflavin biosynthesis pyrimidine reductase
MAPSIDGRIVVTKWKVRDALSREYECAHRSFGADAWMIGRISMEPYAGKTKVPRRRVSSPIPRTDFVARRGAKSYAIALDPSGKLTWRSGSIDEEHVITVLTEKVSDAYLAFLRSKGVSYVFGGKKDVDLKRVLQKLRRKFGIRKLLLEGGGGINGSFLAEGLIDELSVLVAPVADGSVGTPSLFDVSGRAGPMRPLKLVSFERRPGDLMWLRYKRSR